MIVVNSSQVGACDVILGHSAFKHFDMVDAPVRRLQLLLNRHVARAAGGLCLEGDDGGFGGGPREPVGPPCGEADRGELARSEIKAGGGRRVEVDGGEMPLSETSAIDVSRVDMRFGSDGSILRGIERM
jgi:hypothetical protein